MQGRKTIKILATVTILVIICVAITYVKSDTKEVLATTKEFNSENLQDNEHMHVELDSSGDKVPVPNGYVGSKATGENEIDTGYVIYEGEEEVNDSNVEEAQKTRNQYVWIPVPDASTMYGTDENGKKWGKLYNFATTSIDANYDNITGAYPLNWSESDGNMTLIKSNNREPDTIRHRFYNFDMDTAVKNTEIKEKSTHELLNQLEKEFCGMIESVEKNGGFYIGRYETGNLNKDEAVLHKSNTEINGNNWYNSYVKCKTLRGKNTNIETGMIWGCQWDRALIWLVESGSKTKEEICEDSTNWGNYINATFEYINYNGNSVNKNQGNGIRIPTGSSEYTKANNVYDLAGNSDEWTLEANLDRRIFRGGNNNTEGSSCSYIRTSWFPDTLHGCRAMLYIK